MEEGDNAEYWKNQLPFYQKTIDLTKDKVQEEIDLLSQKGVNVTEIEQQTKITGDKIAEMDKRLEDLPQVRQELVEKYREEKYEQLVANAKQNYVKERETENYSLFSKSDFDKTNDNYVRKNGNSLRMNVIQEQVVPFQRKR